MDAIARKLSLLVCVCILAVSGCTKYRPQPLSIPNITPEEKDGIEVFAQALTESECRKTFSRRILNKQYQPIQLVIKNKSQDIYILDAANIELDIAPTDHVIKQGDKDLSQDIEQRTISDDARIFLYPGNMINKILFVSDKNYRSKFKINLLNKETDDLVTFAIQI